MPLNHILPSRFAPRGISPEDERKTITVGCRRSGPIEYSIRHIADKVAKAASHSADQDIEMVPLDEYDETQLISEYVSSSRMSNQIDYDSMDIDGVFSPINSELYNSFLVIDTNFILSHLKIIDEITKTASQFSLRIIIPIAVMKELDGLKISTKSVDSSPHDLSLEGKTIGHLARWANDWIYSKLSDLNSPVKGQTMKQKIDPTAVKDDAILDCCLFLKENYQSNLVVLLSNDKNLCMKALANQVLTVSFKKGMSAEMISRTIHEESTSLFGSPSLGSKFVEKEPSLAPRILDAKDFPTASATVYREVFSLVRSIIHHVMVAIYDEDLDLIPRYNHDKINSLEDCDRVIKDFWISVFSEYLSKINYKEGFITHEPTYGHELRLFVREWSQFLTVLYQHFLDGHQTTALKTLIKRWESMASSWT